MTPPIFHIDDLVEITGPGRYGVTGLPYARFRIEEIHKHEGAIEYSAFCQHDWYQASSLRLVEEGLQIGDFVEIVGAPCGLSKKHGVGKCTQVRGKTDQGNYKLSDICYIYSRSALRKLTPEEIKQHLAPPTRAALDQIEENFKIAVWLDAIEKQLEEQQKTINQFNGEIGHLIGSIQECLMESGDVEARTKCREMKIEKRLAFVEKFQRDQSDLIGRAIRDGVAEILDFRRKA